MGGCEMFLILLFDLQNLLVLYFINSGNVLGNVSLGNQ